MADFEQFVRTLRATLEGKDPRKTASPRTGRLLMLLRDDDETLHRLTIRVETANVEFDFHTDDTHGADWALIRGSLSDGFKYLVDADLTALPRLEVYGETKLFQTIRELAAQKRSALGVRLGS